MALSTSALGLTLGSFAALPAQAADSSTQLPPVSVDATAPAAQSDYKVEESGLSKLTQKLRDTAQTIDTVSQQQMQDQGVTTLHDALRSVPGISLAAGEYGSQGDNLTIRGFSARNDIYLDGMRDFGSYARDPFNTQSVEVLKGPSSVLFGRGSTGGVVEQNSKTPSLTSFTNGEVTFGSDATKRVTADTNQVIAGLEGGAIRLNVVGHDSGYTGRNVGENSRLGIAPSFASGLGTPTRLTLSYLHQTEYDIPDYGLPWLYSASSTSKTALARVAPVDGNNFYGFEHNDYLRTNVDIATAKVEHDFGDTITVRDQARFGHYQRSFRITEPQIYGPAAPGASGTSILVSPTTPLSSLLVSRNGLYGTSLETFLQDQIDTVIRVNSGPLKHTLIGGLELGRETSDPNRNTTIGPYSTTPLTNPDPSQIYNASTYFASRTNTTALSQAAYVYDTVEITPQWQFVGGVRFDRFDSSFNQVVFANPITKAGAASVSLSRVDEKPSWRVGTVYKPLPYGSVYVDYGTSFNPSAEALSLSTSTSGLAPETNETYEVGTKWDLLHERIAINGTLYHTEKTNLREADPNNSNFQILVGDAVAKGAELSVTGRITDAWQINAGYAYTFSEVVSSPQTDLGHRLANVPMHTANLWTTYVFPNKLQIGGGINYVGSRYAATTATVVGGVSFWKEAPGYYTMGAMAKYPLTERVGLQLNVINLTDQKYDDLLHPSHVVPGEGRTVLASTSVAF